MELLARIEGVWPADQHGALALAAADVVGERVPDASPLGGNDHVISDQVIGIAHPETCRGREATDREIDEL